jgi:O-antigen/teichoic acid export membrane protein
MTNSKLLARNAALNFAGLVAPLIAALVAIPWLIRGLGADRFGVLTLAWAAVGYFGFVDLGLGRALTHAVATRLGSEREHELSAVGWTALTLMFLLGVIGGVALATGTPWFVKEVLRVPPALGPETVRSFYLLAAVLPIVVTTAGLRGIIEAHQHFGLATALRVPLSISSYVGPLLVLPITRRLDAVVAALVLVRIIGFFAHVAVCVRRYGFLRHGISLRPAVVGPLVRIGGWMTVSNVVSPIMAYFDRFLIGALLPLAAVAYYVTPYEAVMKLTIFPTALMGVLFPAFAQSFGRDGAGTAALFDRGVRAVVITIFPAVLVIVTLASEILHAWVGPEFARAGSVVLQWLAVGVLINAVGIVAFAVLQGVGRPDLTGKLNLAELPVYIVAIILLARTFGLPGVALAWTLRVLADTALLCVMARRELNAERVGIRAQAVGWLAIASALVAGALCPTTTVRIIYVVVALAGYLPIAWMRLMTVQERSAMVRLLRRAVPSVDEPPRQAA